MALRVKYPLQMLGAQAKPRRACRRSNLELRHTAALLSRGGFKGRTQGIMILTYFIVFDHYL